MATITKACEHGTVGYCEECCIKSCENNAEHCLMCGNTHDGECSPSSFVYFHCKACGITSYMPWDAVAFCGLDGWQCGCEFKAQESWIEVDYETYKHLEAKEAS